MPNYASRLTSNGNFTINGTFDEITSGVSSNGLVTIIDAGKAFYASSNVIPDLVGNNNAITQNSPTFNAGNGGYFSFNPSNQQYITTNNLQPYPGPAVFSLGVWFQTSVASGTKIIGYESWQYQAGIANYDRQLFVGFDGKLHFGLYPLDYNPSGSTTATVTDGIWHYAVATYNQNTGIANLYLDGVLANTVTGVTSDQNYVGWWKIGGTWTNGWPLTNQGQGYFNGNIGPTHIYNRDITAAEVLNNYQNDSTRFGRANTIIGAKSMANNISNTITYSANTLNEVDFNSNSGFQKNLVNYSYNLVANSQIWQNTMTLASSTDLAPDGSKTAVTFLYSGSTYELVQQGSTTALARINVIPGKFYTASVYLKRTQGTQPYAGIVMSSTNSFNNFNFNTGNPTNPPAGITSTMTLAPNGFYRCTISFQATLSNENFGIWLGGYTGGDFTGNNITIWGPQLELGNTATIYVPTDGNATVISNTAFKSDNTSTTYTKGFIDEVTGVPPLNGNIISVDPSKVESYSGTGLTVYNLANTTSIGTLTSQSNDYPVYKNIVNGNSFAFDGVDGTINFPNINLQQDFTLEFWVNHTNFYGFAFCGHGTYTTSQGLHIWCNNPNSIRFGMYANDTDYYNLTTNLNQWYHYVFTYQNSSPWTKQAFRNGVALPGSIQYTPAQYLGTGTFRVGGIFSAGVNYQNSSNGNLNAQANGQFGLVNVYNRVLSNAEIVNNYNFQRTIYGV
jgi:hypothetical protein